MLTKATAPKTARFMISVSGVRKVIEAFVVPGEKSYSIILGRPWLRSIKVIDFYETVNTRSRMLLGSTVNFEVLAKATIKAPEVYLAEDATMDGLDENLLVDLVGGRGRS